LKKLHIVANSCSLVSYKQFATTVKLKQLT
jgi:hypothetical protein